MITFASLVLVAFMCVILVFSVTVYVDLYGQQSWQVKLTTSVAISRQPKQLHDVANY